MGCGETPSSNPKGTEGLFPWNYSCRGVRFAIRLYVVPRLKRNAAVPLLFLHDLTACTGITSHFSLTFFLSFLSVYLKFLFLLFPFVYWFLPYFCFVLSLSFIFSILSTAHWVTGLPADRNSNYVALVHYSSLQMILVDLTPHLKYFSITSPRLSNSQVQTHVLTLKLSGPVNMRV